ncbi:MAG TPA: GspH/FimT family pseudopilin [Gemmatimonadales bacterium]
MQATTHRPRKRSTGGFSLVEAMVVVVILGVLALIFAPRLEPLTAGRAVNGARAGFTNLYNLARTYAVQSRGVATVEVIGGRAVATITVGGVTRSIGSAVAFDSTFRVQATANPTSITIQPSGLVTTGLPFELVLTRSDAADTVRISGYGRVE